MQPSACKIFTDELLDFLILESTFSLKHADPDHAQAKGRRMRMLSRIGRLVCFQQGWVSRGATGAAVAVNAA